MRPPEFTGGNVPLHTHVCRVLKLASMRPPEFTGGNDQHPLPLDHCHFYVRGFNEAAGIHRRKHHFYRQRNRLMLVQLQ